MSDERAANAIDRKIGQQVRTRRLEIGMSQERLAELLGVTFQQVQKYEKGVNRIAASRLYDIAAALNMPVGQFYANLKSTGKEADRAQDALLDPEISQALIILSKMKPTVKRRALDLLKALAD